MPAELREFSQRVEELFLSRGMGKRSRFALRKALEAAEADGIGGVFVIKIPPNRTEWIDVDFTLEGSMPAKNGRDRTVGAA